MKSPYFKPFIGQHYKFHRVLIISESTYDWLDEMGGRSTPQPTHPRDSIKYGIVNFDQKRNYFRHMNRALTMKKRPSVKEMRSAWKNYAYTVFVQESVGFGARTRPKGKHWKDGGQQFLSLLEIIRPRKVIVTGFTMWKAMPECAVRLLDDLQAYRLSDGNLVWCLAIPHPSNSTTGFQWNAVAESINIFRNTDFPLTLGVSPGQPVD